MYNQKIMFIGTFNNVTGYKARSLCYSCILSHPCLDTCPKKEHPKHLTLLEVECIQTVSMVLNNHFKSVLHIASICADCDHSCPLCSKNSNFYLRGFFPSSLLEAPQCLGGQHALDISSPLERTLSCPLWPWLAQLPLQASCADHSSRARGDGKSGTACSGGKSRSTYGERQRYKKGLYPISESGNEHPSRC